MKLRKKIMFWGLIWVLALGVGGAAYGIAYHTGAMPKIENSVTGAYNKVQDGVVSGYGKVQDSFVSGAEKVENAFVPSK